MKFYNSSRRVTARYAVNESSFFTGCHRHRAEDENQGGIADTIDEIIGSSLSFKGRTFFIP